MVSRRHHSPLRIRLPTRKRHNNFHSPSHRIPPLFAVRSVDLLVMAVVVDVSIVMRCEEKRAGQIAWQCMVHIDVPKDQAAYHV